MRVAYAVVTLIAFAIFCGNVALLIGGHVGVIRAVISLAVVSVALTYCIRQLMRPVPLKNTDPDPESEDDY
jgi:hypothetical protein